MAQHTIVAHKGKPKPKRELKHIHIEKAANGFSIKKRYAPAPGGDKTAFMDVADEQPAVFTKHRAANSHLRAALAEMHPNLGGQAAPAPDEDAEGAGTPIENA